MANDPKALKQRLDALAQIANAEIRINELMGERTDKVAESAKLYENAKNTVLAELDALNKIGERQEAKTRSPVKKH